MDPGNLGNPSVENPDNTKLHYKANLILGMIKRNIKQKDYNNNNNNNNNNNQSIIYVHIYIRPTAQEQKNSVQCTSYTKYSPPAQHAGWLHTKLAEQRKSTVVAQIATKFTISFSC